MCGGLIALSIDFDDNHNRRDSGVSRGDGCECQNGAQRSFGANAIARSNDRAKATFSQSSKFGSVSHIFDGY
jgi:hypothetical protein